MQILISYTEYIQSSTSNHIILIYCFSIITEKDKIIKMAFLYRVSRCGRYFVNLLN
jgi:hypothetical protein